MTQEDAIKAAVEALYYIAARADQGGRRLETAQLACEQIEESAREALSLLQQAEPAPSLAAGEEAERIAFGSGSIRKMVGDIATALTAKDREKDAAVAAEREACLGAVRFSAWKHAGDDAYSQGMDAGARHQVQASEDAIRARSQPAAPEKKETDPNKWAFDRGLEST